jgi:hypothetical protein
MKRPVVLTLALAGLTALLAACGGGGEEAGVLAVAFRLDEGSPVMAAYTGDPAEDPFLLPAGRYYIEALDADDVLLSLGVVDIKDGDAVQLPLFLSAAGGVADPERAESLKTVANFLIDVQLAKYKFLEIVTGGFTESPFDLAVEPDDASLQQLFEMYGDMAAQEDAVLAALSEIEGRVGVSSPVAYVCSSPAFAPDDLDRTEIEVAFFVALLVRAQQMGEAADFPAQACEEGACWVIPLEADRFEGYAKGPFWIAKNPETLAMFDKWQEYAGKLVQDLGLTSEKTSAGQAHQELMGKVRSDFEKWAPGFVPPALIDEIVKFFVKEVAKAVPEFPSAPAPGPTEAKPDTSWIEGFVQKVADKLLEEGYGGLEVASCADDLELCLTNYVEQGLSQEDATAVCVWLFDKLIAPKVGPPPKATPAPTATPLAETPSPTAAATATPAADIGWIEGYVQSIADQWLAAGYGGLDVAVYADDLRQCLIQAVQAGASQEEAKAECSPESFEPVFTPEPTQTPTPEPEPTEAPTPETTPTPEPKEVAAVGQFLFAPTEETVVGNTVTLKFSSAGGDVTLEGRLDTRGPAAQFCDPYSHFLSLDCDGTYSPESGTFGGTCQTQSGTTYYSAEFTGPDEWECKANQSGASGSGPWEATLKGAVVKGSYGDLQFELTVQGS